MQNPNSFSDFQPSNEKRLYEDRFITLKPDFSSKNLFFLFESESPAQNTYFVSSNKENSYTRLLQNELLSITRKLARISFFREVRIEKKSKNPLFSRRKMPHLLKFCFHKPKLTRGQ